MALSSSIDMQAIATGGWYTSYNDMDMAAIASDGWMSQTAATPSTASSISLEDLFVPDGINPVMIRRAFQMLIKVVKNLADTSTTIETVTNTTSVYTDADGNPYYDSTNANYTTTPET